MPLRIVSWNINRQESPWRHLADEPDLDVALLQEAREPPAGLARETVPDGSTPWATASTTPCNWRTAIARFSNRITLRPRRLIPVGQWEERAMPVSREGSLTAAVVEFDGMSITLVSAYAVWETPSDGESWIFADASAHRLISDVSSLIASKRGHRVIVAGDFNLLRGYGENGDVYWKGRYETVFARMAALGLPCVGPRFPHGRCADPWPEELPRESSNVPTYRSTRQGVSAESRQLDFVFASEALVPRLSVRARNGVDEWGPSDHCRIDIELREQTA